MYLTDTLHIDDISRDFQKRMSGDVHLIHKKSSHAYIQAPTGVGKTFLMIQHGEKYHQSSVKVILAGSKRLVTQHQEEIAELNTKGLISDVDKWVVMTWQLAIRAVKIGESHRDYSLLQKAGIMFFDECHFGGTSGKSIKKVRETFKPELWVNVSATPWDVNEEALGKVKGHTTYMSYEEAYKKGYLNPLTLHRVDVGLEMTLKAKEIEAITGKPFYQIAEKSPEEVVKILEGIGRERGTRITAKDVEKVVEYRIKVMIELYGSEHLGEKSLFWVPNISYVEFAVDYFNDVMVRKCGEGAWADGVTSENSNAVNEQIISDFMESEDKRALFVVYMLNEGYNHPELRLGFDCSFNPSNIRRMLQKMGRTMRPNNGKGTSHYYYAVDVRTLLSSGGMVLRIRDDFQTPESLAHLNPDDTKFGMEAFADRFSLVYGGEGGFNKRKIAVKNENVTVITKKIEGIDVRMASIPFFTIEKVKGSNRKKRSKFRDLFRSSASERKKQREQLEEDLIQAITRGEEPAGESKLRKFMFDCCDPKHALYNKKVRKVLYKHRRSWVSRTLNFQKWLYLQRLKERKALPPTRVAKFGIEELVDVCSPHYDATFTAKIKKVHPDIISLYINRIKFLTQLTTKTSCAVKLDDPIFLEAWRKSAKMFDTTNIYFDIFYVHKVRSYFKNHRPKSLLLFKKLLEIYEGSGSSLDNLPACITSHHLFSKIIRSGRDEKLSELEEKIDTTSSELLELHKSIIQLYKEDVFIGDGTSVWREVPSKEIERLSKKRKLCIGNVKGYQKRKHC